MRRWDVLTESVDRKAQQAKMRIFFRKRWRRLVIVIFVLSGRGIKVHKVSRHILHLHIESGDGDSQWVSKTATVVIVCLGNGLPHKLILCCSEEKTRVTGSRGNKMQQFSLYVHSMWFCCCWVRENKRENWKSFETIQCLVVGIHLSICIWYSRIYIYMLSASYISSEEPATL